MEFPKVVGSGMKNYLKLKAGESVRGVFRGNPFPFEQHWHNNKSSVCLGEACPLCKSGNKASFRFRINFVASENGGYTAKVFEQGWTAYEILRSLHESDYDLEKTIVKITRSGAGTDTTYSIVPAPRWEVTPDIEKKISETKLNNLSNDQSTESTTEASDANEDEPF